MDLEAILRFLQSLGLSPIEILTLVTVVILYRDNRLLFDRLWELEKALAECIASGGVKDASQSQPKH
jgi:hypothetical protein